MCDKIPHSTWDSAREHQRSLIKRKHKSAKIYRCKECGFLHITTEGHKKKRWI